MQFYILMVDYGRKGLEAIVDPEFTRADIVSQARDALKGNEVAFVKFVDGNTIEDVTEEIVREARMGLLLAAE